MADLANSAPPVDLDIGDNGGNGVSDQKQPTMKETVKIITDAVPLTWRLQGENPVTYLDGKFHFGLPFGWFVELRPRTSGNYIGKFDKVVSISFNPFLVLKIYM